MKEHLLQSTAWESYERLENRQTFRLENNKFSTRYIRTHTIRELSFRTVWSNHIF